MVALCYSIDPNKCKYISFSAAWFDMRRKMGYTVCVVRIFVCAAANKEIHMTDIETPTPTPETPTPPPTPDGGKEASRDVDPFAGKKGKWLENYWYHYKTQTIIAFVLIVAIVICMVQCFTRPPAADYHFFYFGPKDLRPTSTNTISADMEKSMAPYANGALGKTDGSAVVDVSFYTVDHTSKDNTVKNASQQGRQALYALLQTPADGNGFLFLLSEVIYHDRSTYGMPLTDYMQDLTPYLPAGSSIPLARANKGVYVRDTILADLPGFCELPKDTVLCMHLFTELMQGDAEYYATCEALFRTIFAKS